jgi:hypothetical protein
MKVIMLHIYESDDLFYENGGILMLIKYKKGMSILLVMLMVIGGFSGLLIGGDKAHAAVAFAGGTGTIEDPYQIATAAQLSEVRYYMRSSFKLIAEIDLSTYAVGEGWMPIGDDNDIFRGILDGNGYKIKNLVINRPTTDYVGLFGVTAFSDIRNIALENINVKGGSYTGGLVGNNSTEGTISNSSVSGSVNGGNESGGLVGTNEGPINTSYSTASVIGVSRVGGLVGFNFGAISSSYATGSATGSSKIGGLVGESYMSTRIKTSYAIGLVSGSSDLGGLVGVNNGDVSKSFYDSTATEQALGDSGRGIGKLTADMKDESTYSNAGWDMSGKWDIDSSLNNGYPHLNFVDIVDLSFAGGAGSIGNPFQIANAAQLNELRYHSDSETYFKQIADIDLSTYADGDGWMPIGYYENGIFGGNLDGNGYKIRNLTINRPTTDKVGLFATTAYNVLKNIILENIHVTGKQITGGLVGDNQGTISYSSVTGSVYGESNVGGLAGRNLREINTSFSTVSVYGESSVGGLVGYSQEGISNSYATGSVYGESSVGGLVGHNAEEISNSYATGSVFGLENFDGLVGSNGGTISSSVFDWETTGQVDDEDIARSTTAMKSSDTYTDLGWDLSGMWGIDSSLNNGYPYLNKRPSATIVGVTKPEAGATPVSSIAETAEYTASITWSTGDATFAANKVYTATITLTPKIGYTLTGVTSNYFKVARATATNSVNAGVIAARFGATEAVITAPAITGVTVPVAGATPVATLEDTTAYRATITWSPVVVTFAGAESYTATITLTPRTGYTLLGVAEDFFKVSGASTTNAANAGVIIAQFPATASSTATLTSTIGTVSTGGTANETITSIPSITTLDALKAAITKAANATFEIYDADGITIATALSTGKKIIVTAQDGITKVTYILIVNAPDITVPVITLVGNETVNLTNGASYNDAGATASDNIDGDLTNDIVVTISNNVNAGTTLNTAVAGTYTYHYNVSDTAGNAAQEKTRTVVVAAIVNTSTPSTPTNAVVMSTDGHLMLPAGRSGEVSLIDEVTVSIPVGATDKELKLTIEKVLSTQNLLTNKEILLSSIYEILKNFPDNFIKPVTLIFVFDPASLKSNQRASVFYYDEVKKVWVEVGGKVNGNHISVEVNHFTKYAVLAVGGEAEEPTSDTNPALNFSDISGHWAEVKIKQAVSSGIVKGYLDGTFKPSKTVTRAEFTVMLMNALKPQREGSELAFTDSAKIGDWAQKAVAQAVQAGIINGYKDGTFSPNAEITRAEMAEMLANAFGQSIEANAATGFADDKDIPVWAKGSVAYVKQAGIVQGKSNNRFAPQDHATRAEAVTVLMNMLEKMSK